MPSTNLQVNFRVSEAEMAAIEAAKPPGMTLGAFAKAATLDAAGQPLQKAAKAKSGVCRTHGAVLMRGRDRCSRYDCKG